MALLSLSGLQSITVTTQTAAPHLVKANIQLPVATSSGTASSVVATVLQNGSTKYTGTPGALGLSTVLETAVGDTITVTLASSNSIDTPLNAVRAVVGITASPS